MADIFVYKPNCEDFDTLGECGPLECTSAKFVEEANGTSELTIEHPIDPIGRWSFLTDGYILMAEVPVRTTPEIKDGVIVTSTEVWQFKSTSTKNERGVYSKSSGGKKLATLPKWTDKAQTIHQTVLVVDKDTNRYKIKYKKGYGWVNIGAIEYVLKPTDLDSTPEAIETVVPAWSVRPQLFRMYAPEVGDDSVVVKARHIFYDLLGNSTTYTSDNPTCGAALGTTYGAKDSSDKLIPGILNSCVKPHDFVGRTNVGDQRVIADWKDVSPVDAILGVETGLTSLWGVDLIRDDWEITILNDAGLNRGVRIEYAKNLESVKVKLDTSDLITSIKPVGQTYKGKPLYLVPGTYVVDGKTVVVDESLTVASDHESEYPVPHVFNMDVGRAAKAVSKSSADVLAARKKMIKACLDKFKNESCDLPLLNLTVDFVTLGDTEEGKQYKELENVYLFDRVAVWHPKIAVDVLTSVKRVEFDPVTGHFLSIEVGPVRRDATRKKIPSWDLPAVVNVGYGAVGSGALADNAVNSDSLDTTQMTSQDTVEWAASVVAGVISGQTTINDEPVDPTVIPSIKIPMLDAVTAHIDDLVTNNVTTDTLYAALATLAVAQITTANIDHASINWAEIQTLSVELADIAAAAISEAVIDGTQIKDASITDAKIINLSATKITAGTIDANEITVINLHADSITVGQINGQQIAPGAVDTDHLVNGAISGDKIDLGAVSADKMKTRTHIIY